MPAFWHLPVSKPMGLLDLLSPRKRAGASGAAVRKAAALYGVAVAQARDPDFYTALGVPDTLDGRFDLIVLHVHLLCRRLSRIETDGPATAQAVFDTMFHDMDRNLREMGVGDPSVPRRIKAMITAYYGRVAAYESGFAEGDAALTHAIARNVYNASPESGVAEPAGAAVLAGYARRAAMAVDAADPKAMLEGRIVFPAVVASRM